MPSDEDQAVGRPHIERVEQAASDEEAEQRCEEGNIKLVVGRQVCEPGIKTAWSNLLDDQLQIKIGTGFASILVDAILPFDQAALSFEISLQNARSNDKPYSF